MRRILSLALISLSEVCFAGWVSSGGEFSTDANNPWFLGNTTNVSYCVQVADDGFPHGVETMDGMIREVFDYWRREFLKTTPLFPMARSATQSFQRENCLDSTQIKFQFGFMTDEQLKVIQNPNEYIALSVRTDYDKALLRGRGFVYVSAESGRFKPSGEKILEKPWQICDGCRLKRVLAHEVGHIFGLSHTAISDLDLMAPGTPENMVSKYWVGETPTSTTPLPPYFESSPTRLYRRCLDPRFPTQFDRIRRFFGASNSAVCFYATQTGQNREYKISSSDSSDHVQQLGTIEIDSGTGTGFPAVRIHLTPEQTVFPDLALNLPFVIGAEIKHREEVGSYKSADGATIHPIIASITPHVSKINGFLGDQFINDIFIDWHPY